MASGGDVLNMLLPNNRCVIYGNDYDSIVWNDTKKITKEEFEAGFGQYDAWKSAKDAAKESARQAILDRIGITAEEAKLLLA